MLLDSPSITICHNLASDYHRAVATKRRTHGSGSIRELRPGVWRLVADAPPDPVTGRRRQVTRTVRGTKGDAQRALTALKASIDVGPVATSVTVAMLIDRMMARARLRTNTRRAWDIAIRDVLEPRIGQRAVRDVTPMVVRAMWARAEDDGVSLHSLRRSYTILKRSFDLAREIGWTTGSNPVAGITPTPVPVRSKVMSIEPDVLRALLDRVAHDVELHAWLRIAAATGARRGEVVALRWADIDTTRNRITIDEGVTVALRGVEVGSTKTGAIRHVHVGPATMAAIDALRAKRVADCRLAGVELDPQAFLLCRDLEGRTPWRPDTTSKRFRDIARSVPGAESLVLHSLRHVAASILLAEGYDVETVADRLGHRSARMTLDVYGAAMPSRARAAGQTMDDLLA